MTKGELIKAIEEFPDDIEIYYPYTPRSGDHDKVTTVTEICPTETDTSENYLLIS